MTETTTLHVPSSIRLTELQRFAFANGLCLVRRPDGSYEMLERQSRVVRINFTEPRDPRPAA